MNPPAVFDECSTLIVNTYGVETLYEWGTPLIETTTSVEGDDAALGA
jgi:hypothetical protein